MITKVKALALFIFTFCIISMNVYAQTIKGIITDKTLKDPLAGVQILIKGTAKGTVTDINGEYILNRVDNGNILQISFISFKTIETRPVVFRQFDKSLKKTDTLFLNFEMESDNLTLNSATVSARKNMESEGVLKNERMSSSYAIENMGAKEMSVKGISTVAEGVQKVTGIAIAEAGQLIVRGLGDRYSITTLNGLPIASPNPDNKLIPLDLFPTSTVKNITVSKVYQPAVFADYSGAHIDIGTRENIGDDFLSVTLNAGGKINSLFKDFYKSDNKGMFRTNKLSNNLKEMSPAQFSEYIKTNNPFGASFSISKHTVLPDLGGSLGIGKTWNLRGNKLSLLFSAGIDNSKNNMLNSYVTTLTAQGTKLNEFNYDSYTAELRTAALASIGYSLKRGDRINYTLFYARNAVDNYKRREGFDAEGVNLVGSNSVYHVYSLLNNQLSGMHSLGKHLNMYWSGSYGSTQSNEPDRKQVMFRTDNGVISLFKLNKQETMRYFGELSENEIVGDLKLKYMFGENNSVRIGGVYKNKKRDYSSIRFYYNLSDINPSITDIYNTDNYINGENIANGTISVIKDAQPKSSYFAGSTIYAGFAELDYHLGSLLIINAGLRYESATQWVRYWNDASIKKRTELSKGEFFPALNIKYSIDKANALRLALSRTVTRPSFIEMAPFLYKESYGSAEIRGNENLQNGYNYNIDLRYEIFSNNSTDMISVTGYYKYLSSPIERVQESSGGSAVHSFRNADDGMATGLEMELHKKLLPNLRFSFNASYMYTNVVLPENGGVYTDSQRALQGASPYIINADITYSPKFSEISNMSLSLLYNLQGPRIQAVGIYGMSNVIQRELHTLDINCNYNINKKLTVTAQMKNILNSAIKFTQEIKNTGKDLEVERFKIGTGAQIGINYKF